MKKNTGITALYYSTRTVCKMLDVSRSWIWEQVKAGNFTKPVKFGRLSRYPVEAIEKYIKEQERKSIDNSEDDKNGSI